MATPTDSQTSFIKKVTLKPAECVVVDAQKQKELFQRLSHRQENPNDVYKQMLIEAWSVEEEKSQKSMSVHTLGMGQTFEVVVTSRSPKDDLPIVGYTPIYAQPKGELFDEKRSAEELAAEAPVRPKDLPKDLINTKSSKTLLQYLEELHSAANVTPFDKFVPHETMLPDLEPAVLAKLLSRDEVDPVRGEVVPNQQEEAELEMEAELNLPKFEDVMANNEEVKKKMKENMKFWNATSTFPPPPPPSDNDLKLLDYATLCNMYTGTWGMDEDTMMVQFFYKFQFDDAWRNRLKKGCFNLLDECNLDKCGICEEVNDKEMSKMKDDYFFEIEDKNDYQNVVMKIREDYNNKFDEDSNWEFKQLIMNPVDSDLDSDEFLPDEALQLCGEERPSSKEWIRAKEKWVSPKGFDVQPKSEEDQRPEDLKCEGIERLRYKDLVPHQDQETLERETLDLMKTKFDKKRADDKRGFYWRAKSNYLYRWPDYRRKKPKK